MVFVTTGLGGGTGTGAAPIIASLAVRWSLDRGGGDQTVCFEGRRRLSQAERGLAELIDSIDTTIVIPMKSCWLWRRTPGSLSRSASPMTSCAKPCRASQTSSRFPASSSDCRVDHACMMAIGSAVMMPES